MKNEIRIKKRTQAFTELEWNNGEARTTKKNFANDVNSA